MGNTEGDTERYQKEIKVSMYTEIGSRPNLALQHSYIKIFKIVLGKIYFQQLQAGFSRIKGKEIFEFQ